MTNLHAHYIEMLWFAESLALLLWFIVSARRAIGMSAYLKANQINGLLQISADNIIQQELLRTAIGSVMVVSSGAALFLAPPPPDYTNLPQTVVLLVAWNLVGGLMLLQSMIDRSANIRLRKYKRIEVSAVVGIIEPGVDVEVRAKETRDAVIEKGVEHGTFSEPEVVVRANDHEANDRE